MCLQQLDMMRVLLTAFIALAAAAETGVRTALPGQGLLRPGKHTAMHDCDCRFASRCPDHCVDIRLESCKPQTAACWPAG
jgi:hypothetical protein